MQPGNLPPHYGQQQMQAQEQMMNPNPQIRTMNAQQQQARQNMNRMQVVPNPQQYTPTNQPIDPMNYQMMQQKAQQPPADQNYSKSKSFVPLKTLQAKIFA
ncbi:hypothetical protein Ciccas_006029 [Cichlidogyrus casuarinus]|uniref:Uncharacterized protein n=1 Tax=Cichlidogyrus casuarinus TaxID=1844966 RepID=A0ABD2Q843_9PLAT